GAKSKLTERNWRDRVIRETKNGHLLALDQPVDASAFLPDPHAELRVPERVGALAAAAFEPGPMFDARPPIQREIERPELHGLRSHRRARRRRGLLRSRRRAGNQQEEDQPRTSV